MTSAYKSCPRCQTSTYLNADRCSVCGHVFSNNFQQPPMASYPHANPNYLPPPAYGAPDSQKLLFTMLFWFFLGHLGAHRLYMGHTSTGILMLVLYLMGWATVCIFIGWPIVIAMSIWWIVDLVLILTGQLRPTDGSRLV